MAQASIGPQKPLQNTVESDESAEEEEDDEEKGPAIPDRATIDATRAKRQQLQQPRHAAPDFISLDGGGVLSSRDTAGGSSDEEDNEMQGRIAMYSEKPSEGHGSSKGVFHGINNRVLLLMWRLSTMGLWRLRMMGMMTRRRKRGNGRRSRSRRRLVLQLSEQRVVLQL
jgi:hypothetical protein